MSSKTNRIAAIRKADEILARPPEVLTQLGNGTNRADRRHLSKHNDPECQQCKNIAVVMSWGE